MFLPEELDNKTFRLFVQRSWYLKQGGLTLTRTEQDLADLITGHPEIAQTFSRKMIDISTAYGSDAENPFLLLAALWEISKQISADKPKGIRSVLMNGFPEEMVQRERRRRMAEAYIHLCHQGDRTISDIKYLRDLEKAIHTDFSVPDSVDETGVPKNSFNIYVNNMFQEAFSSVSSSFHQAASRKPITLSTKLVVALNQLPTEWIDGIATCWQRPEKVVRKERIQDLVEFFSSEEGFLEVSATLSQQERQALKMVLEGEGSIRYSRLTKAFGDETGDAYYWSEQPPRSLIGRLRYKGLLYIGMATIASRRFKVAVIPKELITILKNV